MKHFVLLAASFLLIGSTSLALAQDTTQGGTATHSRVKNPALRQLFTQLKSQKEQIAADVKNGKLTSVAASALNIKLKSISQEMRTDFKQNKQNGTRGLTEDQIQQLNQALTANASTIP